MTCHEVVSPDPGLLFATFGRKKHISYNKEYVDGFMRESTFVTQLYKIFLWDEDAPEAEEVVLDRGCHHCHVLRREPACGFRVRRAGRVHGAFPGGFSAGWPSFALNLTPGWLPILKLTCWDRCRTHPSTSELKRTRAHEIGMLE